MTVTMTARAQARPETAAAFDRYVAAAEKRISAEQGSARLFLAADALSTAQWAAVEARLRRGEMVVEKVGATPQEVPGGLIHDWRAAAFLPGATIGQVIGLVQDYDHLALYYGPEVQRSRLLERRGDDFRIAMRLREHKVVTVVLDTEYDVHYGRLDPWHWFSASRSTRVTEVADPGSASEHAGDNHGFLWRLNSYWRFVQVEAGVVVQCEAISLTRDVPTGLGWLVRPFIRSIPPDSLEFTMMATRRAVEENKAPLDSAAQVQRRPAQDERLTRRSVNHISKSRSVYE